MSYYHVYVLFREKDRKLYIGYTNNIERRFKQHLDGEVKSTAPRRPLKLIYFEAHLAQEDALRREKYFKSTAGRRTLKLMLRNTLQNLEYQGL